MRRHLLVGIYRAVGAGIAIGVMEALARLAGEPMVRVPFVTSIVLVIALPESDAAQPKAIIGGHILSTLAGLVVVNSIGGGDTGSAVAVGLAVLLMSISRTLHPPAGIDAFLVSSYGLTATWLLNPVLIGAVLLTAYSIAWRDMGARLLPASPHFDQSSGSEQPEPRDARVKQPWQARP